MYPSPGRPLLPGLLRSHLGDEPVRGAVASRLGIQRGLVLGELDAGIWRRGADTAQALAQEVVRALNRRGLSSEVAAAVVFATRPPLDELDLSIRSRNALRYGGLVEGVRLRSTTVGEVWRLPNLGAVSLLDVLTAAEVVEPPSSSTDHSGDASATLSRAVRTIAGTLARKRWAGSITSRDPRLGHELVLLEPRASNVRQAAEALSGRRYTPSEARRTVSAIREFIRRAEEVRRKPLEDELDEIVASLTERPAARLAILARTGLGGAAPLTLEDAGKVVGVTRERVRQIEKRFKEQLDGTEVWTPVLDRALQVVAARVPATAVTLEAELKTAGLVRDRFAMTSLIAAANIFHKELPFAEAGERITPVGDWAPDPAVRTATRRLVEHWGATTIDDVELRLRDEGFAVDQRLLSLTITSLEGFEWLDENTGWFWVRGTRNRLLNMVLKIMSVAGSIDLSELRTGVGRHHRMRGFRPPREVLAALCVQSGRYRREGDRIIGVEDLPDWRTVLGNNERLLVQALFDFGPVMRRDDLEQVVVVERGLNRSSFYVYLTYAPMIERYAPGVFGLRGAPVTAAEVEAMIPPRVRHQVLQDHGWTESGHLWAAFRISPASESTGILGAPSAVRSVTSGSFELIADDGRPVGTLVIEQNMWGLSPFFRLRGVEAGDFVVIELDLISRQATIAVGTEELLLRYQEGE